MRIFQIVSLVSDQSEEDPPESCSVKVERLRIRILINSHFLRSSYYHLTAETLHVLFMPLTMAMWLQVLCSLNWCLGAKEDENYAISQQVT